MCAMIEKFLRCAFCGGMDPRLLTRAADGRHRGAVRPLGYGRPSPSRAHAMRIFHIDDRTSVIASRSSVRAQTYCIVTLDSVIPPARVATKLTIAWNDSWLTGLVPGARMGPGRGLPGGWSLD